MIAVLILIFLAVFLICSWLNFIWDGKKLDAPGPMPLPIIGNGHLFLGDPTKFLKDLGNLSDKYGGKVRLYFLSDRRLLLTDPKLIEAVTSNNELLTKGTSYDFLHPWLGNGLLTSTGQRWRAHRKFLTPAFHFNILLNFLPIFLKNDTILIEKLRKLADGSPINILPIVALAALDNVAESIMGVSVNAQKDKDSEYVKAIENFGQIVTMRMCNPLGATDFGFSFMPSKKIYDESIKILHNQSRSVIETRRQEMEKNPINKAENNSEIGVKSKHSFLDLLLLAEVNGKKLDDETIREEVDTFLFEGHDTTTTGISFTIFCLSKLEEVQEKIINEQKEILGDIYRDPTYSEIQQMKYLELVIKEALRMYPPVPMIERKVTHDTIIGGMSIPRNTSILLNIFYMHRNPEVFENPLEFHPERFESPNTRNPFTWIPFSAGPRNCIGQKFAMLELKVAVASIVKKFIILPSDIEPKLTADLVLRSSNGVNVRLLPRPLIE